MKKFLLFVFLLNAGFVFAQIRAASTSAPCPAAFVRTSLNPSSGSVTLKNCDPYEGKVLPENIDGNTYEQLNQVLDVKAFGAKGDGITNDTAAFQAAFAKAVLTKGSTVLVSQPSKYYKVSGTINLFGSVGVNVIGTSSPGGLPGADLTNETDLNGAIVFTGSGTAPFINAGSSVGFTMKGIKVIYTSPTFTGDLVSLSQSGGQDTIFALIDHCEFRGRVTVFNRNGTIPATGNAVNARSLISLSNAITSTISNSNFSFADIAILGKIEGQGAYSNVINLNGNHYLRLKTAALKNAGDQWASTGETFEGGLNGESVGYIETVPSISVTIDKGWFGDTSKTAAPSEWIKFKGNTLRVTNSLFSQTSGDASKAKVLIDCTKAAIESVYLSGNLNLYGGKLVEITGNTGSLQQLSMFGNRLSGGFGVQISNPTNVPILRRSLLNNNGLDDSLNDVTAYTITAQGAVRGSQLIGAMQYEENPVNNKVFGTNDSNKFVYAYTDNTQLILSNAAAAGTVITFHASPTTDGITIKTQNPGGLLFNKGSYTKAVLGAGANITLVSRGQFGNWFVISTIGTITYS